jgi:hypothetical protein
MKKIKNSKFKNTGILFELLVRQITADTLNDVKESVASNLIRKYFNKNSELSKELNLYNTIIKEKFNSEEKAKSLVEAAVTARKRLSNKVLNRQKYNLIKEIKDTWDLDTFFQSRVSNYKVHASIYKLFEYNLEDNPKVLVDTKYTLVEHITFNKKTEDKKEQLVEQYRQQDKDVQLLAYRLMVDKFNSKYKGLSPRQKNLLENYINNVSNTATLKEYVGAECIKLTKELNELNKKVDDKVVKIKIDESVKLLSEMNKGKVVKDGDVLSLLRYYELSRELKKVTGDK